MKIGGKHYHTIWEKQDAVGVLQIIDQRKLPFRFEIAEIASVEEMVRAISEMYLRGAILIGVAGAYGMYLGALEAQRERNFDLAINRAASKLLASRPTAANLRWAIDLQLATINRCSSIDGKIQCAHTMAKQVYQDELKRSKNIGHYGAAVLQELSKTKTGRPVNILTHCNAGWLACVDFGTATAPIYEATRVGIPLHVWVDETRPRSQGTKLTSWELSENGVSHTVIVDGASGHIMQRGDVDVVIVGADRVTRTGDVANKIGTYLVGLAANDNNVPFYVAFPSSTIDWTIRDGRKDIVIETRSPDEVSLVSGLSDGQVATVQVTAANTSISNYAFDVTPSRLITGFITERGICAASEQGLTTIFPEQH